MARDTWYRLDNIGKFYSSEAGGHAQTVFRYSATLVDEVDPAILQSALTSTAALFPGFNVCLRSGLFWHYLQQSPEPPHAVPESLPVCFGLHVDAKSVLFRVSYYRERINLEVSHIVSDGRGSLGFFKALLTSYLGQRYGVADAANDYDGSASQKAENSFDKYFERDKAAAEPMPRAYQLVGWRDEADPTFMEYHLPVRPVIDLAHSWGVSLTALMSAAVMASIREEMPRRERRRPIRIDVPVDLRQHFQSATAKNFFGLAFLSYTPGESDEPVEEITRQMGSQLKKATDPDHLKLRMNRMIALEKNPVLRFAPLFLKDLVLEVASRVAERTSTTTVSNLGVVRLDERIAPYVRNMNVLTSTRGLKFTLCSYGDDLSVGISTAFSNHNVEKNLVRFFSSQGIEGYLNYSKSREEAAEDRLEAQFEESVKKLAQNAEKPRVRKPRVPKGDGAAVRAYSLRAVAKGGSR